jgi:hypothetical protein
MNFNVLSEPYDCVSERIREMYETKEGRVVTKVVHIQHARREECRKEGKKDGSLR